MYATIEERRFICGPCRDVITKRVGAMSQWCSARETEKRWRYSSVDSAVVGYSPDSNNVCTEAEVSPLLRPVTRKRLMKTLQA
jgi:hypothetical protein